MEGQHIYNFSTLDRKQWQKVQQQVKTATVFFMGYEAVTVCFSISKFQVHVPTGTMTSIIIVRSMHMH